MIETYTHRTSVFRFRCKHNPVLLSSQLWTWLVNLLYYRSLLKVDRTLRLKDIVINYQSVVLPVTAICFLSWFSLPDCPFPKSWTEIPNLESYGCGLTFIHRSLVIFLRPFRHEDVKIVLHSVEGNAILWTEHKILADMASIWIKHKINTCPWASHV